MVEKFTLYKAGIAFWAISITLVLVGMLIIPGYVMQSVMLILTGVTTFILGGLAVIYAELRKIAK